jgi:hypothetical protein
MKIKKLKKLKTRKIKVDPGETLFKKRLSL